MTGVTVWMLFISMIRDDITKGTHLDGKEKVKERKREENQGKCRPRSQVKRILQSLEPFLLFQLDGFVGRVYWYSMGKD